MKNNRLRITVDIEYESINEEAHSAIKRHLESGIEDRIHELIRDGGSSEISNWSVKSRSDNTSNESIQTQAERITPFAHITAYFSSDGPAFVANVHHKTTVSRAESEILSLTLSDINAALREAHHKYLIKLHEGR